jgi:hypothetical protein
MRRKEMIDLCLAVASGEGRLVRHGGLHYVGEVKACHSGLLDVKAFGHAFEWAAECCRPVDERIEYLGPPSNE